MEIIKKSKISIYFRLQWNVSQLIDNFKNKNINIKLANKFLNFIKKYEEVFDQYFLMYNNTINNIFSQFIPILFKIQNNLKSKIKILPNENKLNSLLNVIPKFNLFNNNPQLSVLEKIFSYGNNRYKILQFLMKQDILLSRHINKRLCILIGDKMKIPKIQ